MLRKQCGPSVLGFQIYPLEIAESRLVVWGRDNCTKKGKKNVQMFFLVGAIPSEIFGPSKTRYFGKNGFSDYQDDAYYPVNVPSEM